MLVFMRDCVSIADRLCVYVYYLVVVESNGLGF